MRLLYKTRGIKSLGLKYEIYDDRLRLQTLFFGYSFEIMFRDIEKVEICGPLVFWDVIKKGMTMYSFRILKNDLADLFDHISIQKKNGYWKQIRITPRNVAKFYRILTEAMNKRK